MSRMDNHNYYGDSRVQESMRSRAYTVKLAFTPGEGCGVEFNDCLEETLLDEDLLPEDYDGLLNVPIEWTVCDMCRGNGKVVDPSLDAGGITGEDFDDDPQLKHDYFSGRFDIKCPRCNGRTTTPVPRFTKEVQDAIDSWEQGESDYLAERLAELRYGC